jgi:acyl-CoA thioesterase FadM
MLRRCQLEYKVAALLDDALDVFMWQAEPRGINGLWHALIRRAADGKVLLRARLFL